ncbi:MAG: winged helix DNA-binding domain-containing protein [Actinomycetota bacterium]
MTAGEALHHLVGMQAQAPLAPYVGLWSRLDGFDPGDLAALISSRAAVRVALLRSTIFLVTAEDALELRPLVQPIIDRSLGSNFRRSLVGVDLELLGQEARRLVDESPRTFAELGDLLAATRPGADPQALAIAARAKVALVQLPPRGLWGRGGLGRHAAAETWIGRPERSFATPEDRLAAMASMVERYLAAFGPASLADIRTWCGLTLASLRPAIEGMRERLVAYRDEAGRELLDLPGAPLPDPAIPAPVRFLPEFDNALLSHADRDRVIEPAHREPLFTRGALLVDGFVKGAWTIRHPTGDAVLALECFSLLTDRSRRQILAEAERLLDLAAATCRTRRIALTE